MATWKEMHTELLEDHNLLKERYFEAKRDAETSDLRAAVAIRKYYNNVLDLISEYPEHEDAIKTVLSLLVKQITREAKKHTATEIFKMEME